MMNAVEIIKKAINLLSGELTYVHRKEAKLMLQRLIGDRQIVSTEAVMQDIKDHGLAFGVRNGPSSNSSRGYGGGHEIVEMDGRSYEGMSIKVVSNTKSSGSSMGIQYETESKRTKLLNLLQLSTGSSIWLSGKHYQLLCDGEWSVQSIVRTRLEKVCPQQDNQ